MVSSSFLSVLDASPPGLHVPSSTSQDSWDRIGAPGGRPVGHGEVQPWGMSLEARWSSGQGLAAINLRLRATVIFPSLHSSPVTPSTVFL